MNTLYQKSLYLWSISLILLIITTVAVVVKIYNSSDLVALHYNVIIGVDSTGGRYELLKIPATGLIILLINLVFAKVQKFNRNFIPFIAALMTVAVNLVLLLAALFLFQVS